MTISPETSIETLAAIVSEALEQAGIMAVLCGGAVVSIYSHNEYQSRDLDFVTSDSLRKIEAVMTKLGFSRSQGRHFVRRETEFAVEFPPGPVTIGDAPVTDTARHATAAGTIRLLTPTDSVKDRLAAFLHWNDRQGVEQALQTIRRRFVNIGKVDRWARAEPGGARERYALVRARLMDAARLRSGADSSAPQLRKLLKSGAAIRDFLVFEEANEKIIKKGAKSSLPCAKRWTVRFRRSAGVTTSASV